MRKQLLKIALSVLDNLQPEKLFKKEVSKIDLSKYKKIYVFGIGKAAKTMSDAVKKNLTSKVDGTFLADEGHPLPTAEGIKKTAKIIKKAQELKENDLAIVLISGGGSAMFVQPSPGISLEDKMDLTRQLLRSGAKINEINTVRKHLSQVKGGNFAKILHPANVLCFVISDVIGNDLSVIASGPLTPDKSTFKDSIKILKKYQIEAGKTIKDHLEKGLKNPKMETPKKNDPCFKNIKVKIIADHSTSAKLAEKQAKSLKIRCKILSSSLEGESRDKAEEMLKIKEKGLLIASGETTVTCKGKGFGGRNQEFVLSALKHLKNGQTVLSIGTDGVDGICPEQVAGAIIDQSSKEKAQKLKLNINEYLDNNDSYTFLKKIDNLIITGPTGTNVGDLIFIFNPNKP